MSDVGNIEATEAAAPAWAWFELGCELQHAERYQEALSAFEQAQAVDPKIPGARTKIAFMHWCLKHYKIALDIYEALVRESPSDIAAWAGLSITAYELRQWDRALSAAQRAFKINPNAPVVLQYYATILGEFRRFKRVRNLLERAVSLDPHNAKLRLSLAFRQLEEGDFQKGWNTFEARWRLSERLSPLVNSPVPRWGGESLAKKNVLIWYEPWQGLGDELLFVRYAFSLAERAKREDGLIMLCCHEPLYLLFGRNLAEHCNELLVTTEARGMTWQLQHFLGRTPMQVPIMSLPAYLGDIPARFPYLMPNPVKLEAWRQRLSGKKNFKIGLSWTGRADHPRNDLRSVPILDLARALKDIPGVTLYSLQRDQPDQARAASLIDFTSELASIDDTGALMSNLDLVIGADSMTAHLAGALDIPAWVLVDVNPYWGWGRYGRETFGIAVSGFIAKSGCIAGKRSLKKSGLTLPINKPPAPSRPISLLVVRRIGSGSTP